MVEMYTEQELREQLYTHWVNGVRVSDARVASPVFAWGTIAGCKNSDPSESAGAAPTFIVCPSHSS
jgi:hypothetical protein